MKKKVLHIINSMHPGGAEILLTSSLATGIITEQYENHLAYFMAPTYLLDRVDPAVHLHYLEYRGVKDLSGLLKRIRKIIRENKIDIIHSHLNPAGLYTHLVKGKNIPQVHTIHTAYSMDTETSPVMMFLEKKMFLQKKNTNVILLSEFTKDDFLATVHFKGKYFVLNNFVNDAFFETEHFPYVCNKKELRIISAGTLKAVKNFHYLIDIFAELKEYNITADIYGSGDQSEYLDAIKKKGVKVNIMGPVQDLSTIMNQYDLYVMPSVFEGFPLAVFEAMAAGIPLFLSDIAPVRSIVKDNAIYFPLNDTSVAAKKLIRILTGETEINVMAKNAKMYALKTVRKTVYLENLKNIYQALLTK